MLLEWTLGSLPHRQNISIKLLLMLQQSKVGLLQLLLNVKFWGSRVECDFLIFELILHLNSCHIFISLTAKFKKKLYCISLYHLLPPMPQLIVIWCWLEKKNAQCASCKLSFIWDKMSTIAQETAYQIVLRNFSEEVRGEGQCLCDLGDMCNQTYFDC